MNLEHQNLCSGPEWAEYLQAEVLPAVVAGTDLGQDMLEIGPGPGAATAWLSQRVASLTALEADEVAADRLAARCLGGNVRIETGNAAAMPFDAGTFDSVGAFTMLHHVPTFAAQYRILGEAHRVLRPGGTLLGSDSLASTDLHDFHAGDTYNPIDPPTLQAWLRVIGFTTVTVTVGEVLMFTAKKPRQAPAGDCRGNQDTSKDREVSAS